MITKVEGTIDNIFSKPVNTKYGQKPVYTVFVGSYSIDCGFSRPPYSQGEYVSLDVEKNRFGKWEIVKNSSNLPGQSNMKQNPVTSSRNKTFPVDPSSGEMAIIRQNSLTNAVTYFTATWDGDSVPPSVEDILKVAYQFADYSSGQREVKMAKGMKIEDLNTEESES